MKKANWFVVLAGGAVGLALGAFLMSVATKEFRAKAGSSVAIRFVLGALGQSTTDGIRDAIMFQDFKLLYGFVAIFALTLIGNLTTGNGDSAVTVFGMMTDASIAHNFGLAGSADSAS